MEGAHTVYTAQPRSAGSWHFEIREADDAGEIVAEVEIGGMWDEGEIRVGGVPFELDRVGMSTSYRMLFERQPLARAESQGSFSNTNTVTVEGAILSPGVELGDRVTFHLTPQRSFTSAVDFSLGETKWGEITKESMLFRHFALRFNPAVPLALQVFCFALLMARFRRRARNS